MSEKWPPEYNRNFFPDLKQELENRLKAAGLRTNVVIVPPGTLDRTEFKARRVIDERDLYDEILTKCKP